MENVTITVSLTEAIEIITDMVSNYLGVKLNLNPRFSPQEQLSIPMHRFYSALMSRTNIKTFVMLNVESERECIQKLLFSTISKRISDTYFSEMESKILKGDANTLVIVPSNT